MQEFFYEETALVQNTKKAKTKYIFCKTFSIIFYTVAVLWFLLWFYSANVETINFLNVLFQVLIPLAAFIFSGIMFSRYKNKMYVDYDYTFVSGSIRLSKVINQIKRKNIMKFDTSDILQLGKYGSDSYEKIESSPNVKKIILTSNIEASEGKEFFYLHINKEGDHKLLIFECTEKFMATVLKFSNKTILEKDYK